MINNIYYQCEERSDAAILVKIATRLRRSRWYLFFFFSIFYFLFSSHTASAATLFASPSSGNFSVGQTITVTIRANTQGAAANTAEANIIYTAETLELVRVSQGSTFYLPAPGSPSRGNGNVYFGGGVPTPGYTGTSGLLGTIVFQARSAGTASVNISGGKVLLNDGFGTDALSGRSGATFNITAAPTNTSVGTVTVTSTTHPDSSQSYTDKKVELSWNRPANAYGYSFELDQVADTIPDNILDTTVTTTKVYEDLADGLWYFHIKARGQAQNSSFGPVTTFKININVAAPTVEQSQPPTTTPAVQQNFWQKYWDKTITVPFYLAVGFGLLFLFLLALLIWALLRKFDEDEQGSASDEDIKQVQAEIDQSFERLKTEISHKLLSITGKTSEALYEKETAVAKEIRNGIGKTQDRIDKKILKIKKKPVKKPIVNELQ